MCAITADATGRATKGLLSPGMDEEAWRSINVIDTVETWRHVKQRKDIPYIRTSLAIHCKPSPRRQTRYTPAGRSPARTVSIWSPV